MEAALPAQPGKGGFGVVIWRVCSFTPLNAVRSITSELFLVIPISPLFALFLKANAVSPDATLTTPVPAGFVLVLINGAVAVADRQLVPRLFLQARLPLPESP